MIKVIHGEIWGTDFTELGWSATPDDRCKEWQLLKTKSGLVCKPY